MSDYVKDNINPNQVEFRSKIEKVKKIGVHLVSH